MAIRLSRVCVAVVGRFLWRLLAAGPSLEDDLNVPCICETCHSDGSIVCKGHTPGPVAICSACQRLGPISRWGDFDV